MIKKKPADSLKKTTYNKKKMNDKLNMDSTIAGSMNARS
jgi:hypothetical protein